MNRLYDKESERVMQAYSTGTEMGHCAYISYLEAELMKFRSPADLPEAGASAERICSVVRCFKQLLYIPCPHKGCHGHLSQYGWHDKTDGTMIYQCNICKNKFV